MKRKFTIKEFDCLEAKRYLLLREEKKQLKPNDHLSITALEEKYCTFDINTVEIDDFPNTLVEFWALCGLRDAYPPELQLELLEQWVKILYGEELYGSLCVTDKLSKISEQQLRLNDDYYNNVEHAPHFSMPSPVEVLLIQIIHTLPAYD